jgi:hypothetical protein
MIRGGFDDPWGMNAAVSTIKDDEDYTNDGNNNSASNDYYDPLQEAYSDQIKTDTKQLKKAIEEKIQINDEQPRRRMSFLIAQKKAEAAEREKRAFTAW